jgi:hypothetical protein
MFPYYTQMPPVGLVMSTERVQSKNLFRFRPQGFIDEDILEFDAKMKELGIDLSAFGEKAKTQTEAEYAADFRAMMDSWVGSLFFTDTAYVEVTTGQYDGT